ncbi:MAG: hypothetical protein SGILL_005951, partial [Bacillariaceae sp.]
TVLNLAGSNDDDEDGNEAKLSPPTDLLEPILKDSRTKSGSKNSFISQIRCQNLAGMTTVADNEDHQQPSSEDKNAPEIILTLDNSAASKSKDDRSDEESSSPNLVAITGETGSGKSLLIGRVADLVTGGKASASFLDATAAASNQAATVEMILTLQNEAHIAMIQSTLQQQNLDSEQILALTTTTTHELKLKRVLSLTKNGQRVKSACYLNDHPVTLKTLKAVGGPLIAIVDAPAAAAALGRPASRLMMIDSGVPSSVLTWVRQLQVVYQKAKRHRQSLEQELAAHNLPVSMKVRSGADNSNSLLDDDDRDLELLRHWVEELNGFEARMMDLRDSLCAADTVKEDESEMASLLAEIEEIEWMTSDSTGSTHSSSLYRCFLDLLEEIKSLDERIVSATQARDAISSLSADDSAYTALDRARKLLFDATNGMEGRKSGLASSAEQAHHLLNQVEDALLECGSCLDDEERGLIANLQDVRQRCPLSAEELLERITEWNTLARKHGISSYQLPSCHSSLRQELDGGVEARLKLPKALEEENKALAALKEGCEVLTKSRFSLCERLSKSITQQLPRLGMGASRFEARLRTINKPSFAQSQLGVEEVDFYLRHGTDRNTAASTRKVEGKLESVASSGEKARVLLAIECLLPGSVRALCGSQTERDGESDYETTAPPAVVIYDEIDAHVGGRASVSVAQMLVEQAKSCQVLSITHSASVAALANTHICVSKGHTFGNDRLVLDASQVEGIARQKELARMASGDMASEEAELFAQALLRDASLNARSMNNATVAAT